jgi:hypothetical protein
VIRARVTSGVAALALLTLASCGKGDAARSADSPSVAAGADPAATPAAPADTSCPMAGDWRACSVKKRLERAGLVPIARPEPDRQPFLSVPGTVYDLGKYAELHVFVYPTREARQRESGALDSSTAAPPGKGVDWRYPPTLMTSNNVLAILVSQNEHLIERVQLAITAGLPAAP